MFFNFKQPPKQLIEKKTKNFKVKQYEQKTDYLSNFMKEKQNKTN